MSEAAVSTTTVSLKDYIIDLDGVKQKPEVTYEVVLENNTDFIVRRQAPKGQKELVILVSQGLYYIRDNKTGTIDPVTNTNLRSFLRDLKNRTISLDQVHWVKHLLKESADYICTVIEDQDLSDMCRHNIPIDPGEPRKYVGYWAQNKKLFTRLGQIFPAQPAEPAKFVNSIPVALWIEKCFGANEAIYFAEKLVQSGVRRVIYTKNPSYGQYNNDFGQIDGFTGVITSEYNINLRRFIDYIFFDLYRQGYGTVDRQFFREYMDYLSMQKNFYGKVREKYPEHFKTAHDVMALKVNLAKAVEQQKNFAEQAEAVKDLEYCGQTFCIVVPTEPRELADEGVNLSHCVGSYIDRVASGECHILFLRRKLTPDQSLVTLQLTGKRICQAQGMNRRSITKEERDFLYRWGREKKIDIAV